MPMKFKNGWCQGLQAFHFLDSPLKALSTTINGTRLVVCAVFGDTVWIYHEIRIAMIGNNDRQVIIFQVQHLLLISVHWSTVSQALTAASNTPVCPTISGLAKFRHTKSADSCIKLRHNLVTDVKRTHFWLKVIGSHFW